MKKVFFILFLGVLFISQVSGLEIGDRVLANWSGDDYWYPGTIIDEKKGEFFIGFDDYDREWIVRGKIIQEELSAGDRVESRWQGDTVYYSGTIVERRGNAIFINYDDGDEEATTINHVRVLEP